MPDLLRDRVVAAIGDLYDVEAEIGRGGSAVVYRAVDVRLRRAVAVKVLPPELAYRSDVRTRFLREAQTAAQLSHPHIVPIYSVDERDGIVYIVMCLNVGESLADRLKREPRPPLDAVRRVLREVSEALAYAHARNVVHRDIKPDNVLLDADSGRAMVTDFGIARALDGSMRLTVTGIAVGTPAYMSPEQALGEAEVDARSDIYSLGIVGYQMLAGELPFRATSTPAMLMKHVGETPAPLGICRPDAPPALCAAIGRALAKKPDDRWPDATHFRDAVMAAGERGAPALALAPVAGLPVLRPAPEPSGNGGARSGDPFPHLAQSPPLPPFPAYPASGDREARERWRAQQRVWRDQVKAHRHGETAGRTATRQDSLEAEAVRPLDVRFQKFRRQVTGTAITLGVLTFVNLVTIPFPWVIFAAWGMLRPLARRWAPLRDAGVSWGDVLAGRLPAELGGRDPKAERRDARLSLLEARRLSLWQDCPALERRVRRFRASVFTAGGAAAVSATSLTIGAGANVEPLFAVFILSGATAVAATGVAAATGRKLRKAGLRLRTMLRDSWRDALKAADPRPRSAILELEAARLVGPEVLAGTRGDAVRRAVADRAEVDDAFVRMSPTDRALLPDVTSTVNGLVERAALLAQTLHRLDEDRPEAMLAVLEERLAIAERDAADTPDRERRLGLLQRQRITLQDLVRRRATLAAQLESATLVLESVRLDLLKLRSAGIQAALGDVNNATQEARALSRDIGYVLDAAAEVRAL